MYSGWCLLYNIRYNNVIVEEDEMFERDESEEEREKRDSERLFCPTYTNSSNNIDHLQKKGSRFPSPTLRPARGPMNVFIEFATLTEAFLKDKTEACAEIMNLYRRSTTGMPISGKLLRERLE
ncbi:hypothetical protein ACJJTC_000007 [Scirpophaga incertulas]